MRKKLQCGMSLIVITVWFIGWTGKPLLAMNVSNGGKGNRSHSKIESVLEVLAEKHSQDQSAARELAHQRKIPFQDEQVTVILVPSPGKSASAIDEVSLSLYGATVVAVSQHLIRAKIPIARLVEIADKVDGISYIRLPHTPLRTSVVSEGVALTNAVDYHSAGYEGQNTRVAVIDVGFYELEMVQNAGELPSTFIAKDFTGTGLTTGSDHGTHVAEIVYDMAPRAQLYLIKIADEVDLENAKDYCITAGVNIISHSWVWPNTNFTDGTGLVCDIASDAHSHNIVWVNAAGNSARGHYQHFFTGSSEHDWHEFAPGDATNDVQINVWSDLIVFLTWDAWPTTDQDYDLYLYDSDFNLVASSTNAQTGTQPPAEKIVYRPPTSGTYHILVEKSSATGNEELKILTFTDLQYQTATHSILPPADATDVMGVGAIDQANWKSGPQQSYSSQGPTNDGRIKPDICGPDGVSVYAEGGAHRGYGTSYATPHVAGAASLLLSRYPSYSADQLRSTLENWAVDMGEPGKDNIYGSGRLNLSASQPPNTPSAPTGDDSGTPNTPYTFMATTADPDGDQVAFKFDWGDGSQSDWTDYVDSGASASASRSWSDEDTYEVKVKAKDTNDAESDWSEAHTIVISRGNQPPNTPSAPTGDDSGTPNTLYTFMATTTDPDGDQVAFGFDWGDGSQSDWTDYVDSGASASASHSWSDEGTYEVKVKAKDTNDAESGWSSAHGIVMSRSRHENEIFSLPAGKWKMISIPFALDDPSPNAVLVDDLGAQNDTVWKLYRWNTANGSYDKYPYTGDFAPGKSLYIISRDAKEVDTGPGTDVSRQTNFVINLPSGWSQIGNPFPFSVAWGEVRVRKDSEVVSISEAQARGWVRDKIWYWDGQSYLFDQAPSGILNSYEGDWVRALLDCELLVPPSEAQKARALEQVIKPKEEFLQLKAKVSELEDSYNFLGFYQTAKDTYDRLDVEEAPPISPYISLFFPHPEWGKNKGDYTQDIRTQIPQATKWIWDFEVKTDQTNQEIVLEWENTLAFPQELHLYLTDSLSNVLANMRKKSSYSFSSSSGLESFKVIATLEALPLPEELHLSEIYSYPNPAHGEGVRFHFHLASSARLTIKIYSISGELVRTLVKDKAYLPGAYEEFWKEDNDRGERLARGLYIFIIQAGNPAKAMSKSGKIVLLD